MSDFGVRHRDADLESGDTSPQSKWRPYPKYKDSGVEWLGEIPAHWEAKRLKLSSFINMGQSPSSDIVNTSGEGLPFLQGNADFGTKHPTAQTFCLAPPKIAEFGDVLLSVRAPVGALNLADQKYGVGRGLCAIRPNIQILELAFCYYVLQIARHQLDELAKGSTYDAVSSSEVSCLIIPLPSIKEQRAIAAFLDRETAKIDALIEKKKRLIELLQEKRTALITQAVTKGLDPTVPMKDSGVEWLGEIPAHWDLLPLKRGVLPNAGAIKTGPFGSQLLTADMQGEDVKVYNQRTVIDRDFLAGDGYISRQKFRELEAFEVHPGDVLVTTRGTIGRCAIVPDNSEHGILHPCLMRIQPDPARLLREYIALLIQESYIVRTQLALASNATTIDVIYSDTMRQVLVPKPPLSEQVAILKRIDERVVEIYRLVETVSEAIARLKEYRTALISAAVTGKIDVRDVGSLQLSGES